MSAISKIVINSSITAEGFLGLFEGHSQVAVLVDENSAVFCYPQIAPFLPPHILIEIKSGEAHKNLETCSFIWESLTQLNFDRKGLLINLGGGVICDMGGFVAATYKRGIQFVQVPTTLLSQVDASVGGKLGVDFMSFKNHIGLFALPKRVIINTAFLETLPERELLSGFAEIVKHTLIADAYKWEIHRSKNIRELDWKSVVGHSVKIKSKIVAEDPQETGLRKILNFGHTVGHAVESYCLEKKGAGFLLHGEAVALGIVCESFISFKRKLLEVQSFESIVAFIQLNFPKVVFQETEIRDIVPYSLQDKKNDGGKIKCVLLNKIGNAVFDQVVSLKEIEESLAYYLTKCYQ